MKSKAARDAINCIIEDKLRRGSNPGKRTPYKGGRSILGNLSELIDKPLTLEEQTYLNERKLKNMGFTINEEIKTKLNYKEIALLAVAVGEYTRRIKDKDPELVKEYNALVDRLGVEMYAYPKNDFT